MRIIALLPAAGSGKRVGGSVPKQFITCNKKELLAYTLEVFQRNKLIHEIAIAVHPDYTSKVVKIKKKYGLAKLTRIVSGGKERQDSVFAALASLEAAPNDLIVVHDAARPLLPQQTLTNAIKHAKAHGSALVAIKAKDTLLQVDNEAWQYPDRNHIFYVQTPQIFRYSELLSAYTLANKNNYAATDESMVMHYAGFPVSIVEGSLLNFKVTTKEDLGIFKELIKTR